MQMFTFLFPAPAIFFTGFLWGIFLCLLAVQQKGGYKVGGWVFWGGCYGGWVALFSGASRGDRPRTLPLSLGQFVAFARLLRR